MAQVKDGSASIKSWLGVEQTLYLGGQASISKLFLCNEAWLGTEPSPAGDQTIIADT